MKPNYYLKTEVNSNNEQLIMLYFAYEGNRAKYSTGQFISSKHWNKAEQRVRKSFTDYAVLNKFLDELERKVKSIYTQALTEGKNPSIQYLRSTLNKYMNKTEEKKLTFVDYFNEFIKAKEEVTKRRTAQKYETLLKQLIAFSNDTGKELSFENMDSNFYDAILVWYRAKKRLDKTVYKNIALIKTFLHWSLEKEYNKKATFIKAFKTFERSEEVIALTNDELFTLYNFKPESECLEHVKDTYCFSCFTGLRFSDVENLKKANVNGNNLNLTTIKTGTDLRLTLNMYAKAILDKYNNELPVMTNADTNKYLKEVCKQAGITTEIQKVRFSGKQRIEKIAPKSEFITFHIARKTHITLSLEKGMRAEVVMKNVTHTDYDSFKKYIAVADKQREKETLQAWNAPLLKVV
jgi:integrase